MAKAVKKKAKKNIQDHITDHLGQISRSPHKYVKKQVNNQIRTFNKVMSIEDTPSRIALSAAIGVFIGFLPLLWFHIFILIPIIIIFRINKLATILGTFIIHPLSMYVMTPVSYWLGAKVLNIENAVFSLKTVHTMYPALFLGSAIFGLVFAIAAYIITYYGVIAYRLRKELKKNQKHL